MDSSPGTGNRAIDCILALENVEVPLGQRISEKDLLQGFLLALKREAIAEESVELPDIFVTEIKRLLASPISTSTEEIVPLPLSRPIAELSEQRDKHSRAASKLSGNIRVLEFALSSLRLQTAKESEKN